MDLFKWINVTWTWYEALGCVGNHKTLYIGAYINAYGRIINIKKLIYYR